VRRASRAVRLLVRRASRAVRLLVRRPSREVRLCVPPSSALRSGSGPVRVAPAWAVRRWAAPSARP